MACSNGKFTKTLKDIINPTKYTRCLPADLKLPSIDVAKRASMELLRAPRQVDEFYSWVPPVERKPSEGEKAPPVSYLLAVSPAASSILGIDWKRESNSDFFRDIVSGVKVFEDDKRSIYPYAQVYGGYQFGVWASQLGDGRAVTIFATGNDDNTQHVPYYEIQLKGIGRTPFARFADGNAVLRSSLREFFISEALGALGMMTTRALSISLLPTSYAKRERIEPCAIVARMAPTWVRFGSFDIFSMRKNYSNVRKLADYVIGNVFNGDISLTNVPVPPEVDVQSILSCCESEYESLLDTRYKQVYGKICAMTAISCAQWQVYGFMNGVLNTDNSSICGLSMDYGPFAFMDTFDPLYSPNHDDGTLRYCYRNQPTMMWWNLNRLAEDFGELLAADKELVDKRDFIENPSPKDEVQSQEFTKDALKLIEESGKFYQALHKECLISGFRKRLGLIRGDEGDFYKIIQPLLRILEFQEIDFHRFFRILGHVKLFEKGQDDDDYLLTKCNEFFTPDKEKNRDYASQQELIDWIKNYRKRLLNEESTNDDARRQRSDSVNPKFVLRSAVLSEIEEKVYNSVGWFKLQQEMRQSDEEKTFDQVLENVYANSDYQKASKQIYTILYMALHPFNETFNPDEASEYIPGGLDNNERHQAIKDYERFSQEPRPQDRCAQASCSS